MGKMQLSAMSFSCGGFHSSATKNAHMPEKHMDVFNISFLLMLLFHLRLAAAGAAAASSACAASNAASARLCFSHIAENQDTCDQDQKTQYNIR